MNKSRFRWTAGALSLAIAGEVIAISALLLTPKPCHASTPCEATFSQSGTATDLSETGGPINPRTFEFDSNHSVQVDRTDCPNTCATSMSWAYKNGYGSTVVGLYSWTFAWGKGECGVKSDGVRGIAGYQTMTPGTYTGFAKTIVGSTVTVAYTTNRFIVN